jgi:integrase/recombinase XerD
MRRRKKPKAVSSARDRDTVEQNGMYPYLLRFLEWFASRGHSPQTVQLRNDGLRRFIRWADERGIQRPQDITRPILERYRRHLYHYRKDNGEPLSFATQQQRLIPLRAFFKYLTRENLILSNPASELELPRVHRRLPAHILSVEEVEATMAQTLLHDERGIRDRAMLETLYSCGIRRAELINLKIYDLDVRNGSLLVRQGKGQKDRYVPLGSRAIHWIRRYLDEVRPMLVIEPDEGYVFLHEFGEAFSKNRFTDMVKKHLRAAGVTKPGACHLFRHAMATHMLNNGADIRFIQAILGHAQLTTTEIYTHVTIAKLKEIHALTHPAEVTPRRMPASIDQHAVLSALVAEDQRVDPESDSVEVLEPPDLRSSEEAPHPPGRGL